MPSLTLYHAVNSRSSIVHWMLEELGEPYDLHVLSLMQGENRQPDYLAVNPMGKVPALKHGDAVVTEASAICCYLADEFPAAGLNVPIGDTQRGPYLKWLFFGPSCVEPAVTDRAFPRKIDEIGRGTLGHGDFDTVMDVLSAGVAPGPYLMGDRFTAADIVIGSGLRYLMAFDMVPKRPEFVSYVEHLGERPALQRATARDQKLAAGQTGATS